MFTLKIFAMACIMNLPASASLNLPDKCKIAETPHLGQDACAAKVTELVQDKTKHALCAKE